MNDDISSIKSQLIEIIDTLISDDNNPQDLLKFFYDHIDNIVIQHVLTKTDKNQTKTAKILGISRSTLRYKLKKISK